MAFSQALANLAPLLEHQLIAVVVTIMKEVTTNLLSVWSESVIVREKKKKSKAETYLSCAQKSSAGRENLIENYYFL